MKKHLIILFSILCIFILYYLFQYTNHTLHTLTKNECSIKIFQLNSKNNWERYRKEDINISNSKKSIKSILTFNIDGRLILDFSFIKDSASIPITYVIKQNKKEIDKFILRPKEKHQLSLNISKKDIISIFVDTYEKKPYWGKLETSFNSFSIYKVNKIIPFFWIILFIFLFYRGFGYLAILGYFMFLIILYSEYLNFGLVTFNIAFDYTFLIFIVTFIFLWIYQLFFRLKKFKLSSILVFLLSLFIILIPLLFMLYALNFDHTFTKESLYAVFQSNSNESIEYIEKFIAIKYIVLLAFIVILIGFLVYNQERKEIKKIENSVLFFNILIFSTIILGRVSDYRLINFLSEAINKYAKELEIFKDVQKKRKAGEIVFSATKKQNGETYVVVIGESLNKNHMGIYGYIRETTPNLSKMKNDGLIIYENAYSNHTHTVPVLSLALTEANQYNNKTYYDSLSIVNILNKANIETYWLTNQTLYGGWDNMVSVIATEANNIVALNHTIGYNVSTQKYDEALINELKKVLKKKTKRNRVIFIHLMGSHSTYSSRYPNDKFSYYREDLNISNKEDIKDMAELNRYDNTVYYNDYVVSSMLKLLKNQSGVNAFLYFSDHADDIDKDLGHSSERFTFEMTEIPFIGWFSTAYQEHYPKKYKNFKSHKKDIFSNDMLYDTFIGLFDIDTDHYKSVYDLSSDKYLLKEEDALVLHGKKKYVVPENYRYWERKKFGGLVTTF